MTYANHIPPPPPHTPLLWYKAVGIGYGMSSEWFGQVTNIIPSSFKRKWFEVVFDSGWKGLPKLFSCSFLRIISPAQGDHSVGPGIAECRMQRHLSTRVHIPQGQFHKWRQCLYFMRRIVLSVERSQCLFGILLLSVGCMVYKFMVNIPYHRNYIFHSRQAFGNMLITCVCQCWPVLVLN